jgi:hypothetical protein
MILGETMKTVQSIGEYNSQDDFYNKGLDIIKRAKEVREELNRYDIRLSSAKYRLEQSPKDEHWTKILEDDLKEQKHYSEEAALLESELSYLNGTMSMEDYTNLLEKYGCMLAVTTPVDHIGSGYLDAKEIAKAVEQEKEMIKQLLATRQLVMTEENSETKTSKLAIIDAELLWFKEDMEKHEWGKEALEFVGPEPERRAR